MLNNIDNIQILPASTLARVSWMPSQWCIGTPTPATVNIAAACVQPDLLADDTILRQQFQPVVGEPHRYHCAWRSFG
jgi:hypothetical protein